jgi:hypothetical protein
MRHRIANNTPAYVAQAIASAQFNGRQTVASGGIFVVLLVSMSLIEAPLSRSEGYARPPENELNMTPFGRTPAYRSATTSVAQVGGASSNGSPTAGEPSCVPSQARDMLTWDPGGAGHRPAA